MITEWNELLDAVRAQIPDATKNPDGYIRARLGMRSASQWTGVKKGERPLPDRYRTAMESLQREVGLINGVEHPAADPEPQPEPEITAKPERTRIIVDPPQPELEPELEPEPGPGPEDDDGPALRSLEQGPFLVGPGGVFYRDGDEDDEDGGEDSQPQRVCSYLTVEARTRDADGMNWGYLLEWLDSDGYMHEWAMPARLLAAGGEEARAALMDEGLLLSPHRKMRSLLPAYIQGTQTTARALCVGETGWHGNRFVLPDQVLGPDAGDGDEERVVFQNEERGTSNFGEAGDLERWRQTVGAACVGQSRLVFAVSAALAAPLVVPIGGETGGFHFLGNSSEGKSTVLYVAASIFGPPRFVGTWRVTSNGLEGIAAAHSGTILLLDEIGEVDPREVGSIAYMLAQGRGKGRANRHGGAKRRATWSLLFLSSGEVDLTTLMREAGKTVRPGQEVRMVSLPADAGAGFGVFDHLGAHSGGAALSTHLRALAAEQYGTAGFAFIEKLAPILDTVKPRWNDYRKKFGAENVPEGAAGQVERVADRFALVAFGGELATELGITGWPENEAERAARACFRDWIARRGGAGNQERQHILAQVAHFLEKHGSSRFVDIAEKRPGQRTVPNQAGFRETLKMPADAPDQPERKGRRVAGRSSRSTADAGLAFYIFPQVFKHEVCAGHQPDAVIRALESVGALCRNAAGEAAHSRRMPGHGKRRVYRIDFSRLSDAPGIL